MRSFHGSLWLRLFLGAVALMTLALCSAADAEHDAELASIQESIDGGQWDAAITAARALLEDEPDDAHARARLGTALLRKARTEEQVLDPARLERAKLANDAAAFLDPSLFRTEVRYDEALRDEAEVELRRAVEEDESILEAYVGLATIYSETGDFTREKAVVTSAAQEFAGDEHAASLLVTFGEKHFRSAAYEEALQLLTPLAEAFPGNPAVAVDYSAALFASGKYERGVEILEKAAADGPTQGNMRRTLGQMYMFLLEWKKAADTFASLALEEPEDRRIPLHQAAALMPLDPAAAKKILEGLIATDPERAEQTTAIASNFLLILTEENVPTDDLVRLASQLNQASFPQLGAAVSAYILRRDPRSIPGRVMLALVYDNMRYHDLALEKLDEATGIIREDPDAVAPFTEAGLALHYGRIHFNLEAWDEAAAAFSRAESLGPLALAAAIAFEQIGDYARAHEHFQDVVDRGEPAALVERARSHLDKDFYAPFRQGP